jgi:phenylacetate-CoA ligase
MGHANTVAGHTDDAFSGAVAEIAFAYDNVPFFRDHMDDAGLKPDDIRDPGDLRSLPMTEKVHYRRNFPHNVLVRGKTLKEPFTLKSQSSGTGGERLTTITHTYTLAARMRTTLLANDPLRLALAACRGQRPTRYAAPNCSDVECATPFTTMADRTLADGTLVLPVAHDLLATPPTMVDQAIAEIDAFDPHWLYVDPTHLAFLIRGMRERGTPPPAVRAIALTYTLATEVSVRQIREFFGDHVPRAEIVSMSELGWVSVGCPTGNMHLNNRDFYTEFLVDGRPCRPGERGELVITSIGDRLLPHLRYRTGDIYTTGAGPCACGAPLMVARHEGREQNILKFRDGGDPVRTVSPREISEAVGATAPIDVYRLEQAPDASVDFRYISPAPLGQADLDDLRDRLRAWIGDAVELRIEHVRYIASDRSGKFTSCVSAVDATELTGELRA